VPYVALDKEGKIREPNKAALRFFGTVAEEIQDKNIFSYVYEEDSEKAEKLFQYYKSNVPVNREEIRMVVKSGAVRWVLLSIFKIENYGHHGNTGLASIFDITEQKQLDKSKTEFVSLASHQLRTPVSTVKWYMEALLSGDLGELSEKQRDYMERIYEVNKNMIDLVDALLNISRIEVGSLKVDLKPVNVVELTESVLVELSSQIEEKNLNIVKQYGDNLKDIKSDPKLLRIVIQNLLSNAVKYTLPGGSVTIRFKDSFFEKSIVISDSGVGIPQSEQEKIFTKMFRASNVRSLEGSQGTGLGLYLVKSMIKAIGGSIEFASEENKGSTFVIKI
jgi:two-component system sensor histidine kinase VicK